MGEQPKLTNQEPWQLIQAFIEQMNQTAQTDQRSANAMQAAPADMMAKEMQLRIAKQLGLEYLPQELAVREPYEQRQEERRAATGERLEDRRSANVSRRADEAIDRDIDRYRQDPEGYKDYHSARSPYRYSGRTATGKTPFPDDLLEAPKDPMEERTKKKALDAAGITVEGYETRNGKLYWKLGKKEDNANPPEPPTPNPAPAEKPAVTGKGDRQAPVVQPPARTPAPASPSEPPVPVEPVEGITDEIPREVVPDYQKRSPLLEAPTGKQSNLKGNQEDLIKGLYDSLTTVAGYSDKGARSILAEIGRENDFNEDLIFGSHSDPANRARNVGFLSWQKDRGRRVMNELQDAGLVHNGRIERTQEAMDVMAKYMAEEMEMMNNGLHNYLKSDDVDDQKAASALGRRFIKWRYNDPKYRSHHGRRDDWYDKATSVLDQSVDARPVIKPTDDPDIFDVLLEDLA